VRDEGDDEFLALDDGVRLRFRVQGQGPAVLLVHGWLLDLTLWDALAAALAPRFRVLRWDRRGFGDSGGLPNLAADVSDAMQLLRHAGVERVALLGMSQGCRVALGLAAAAPAHASCLVLDGAPAFEGLPDRQWHDETRLAHYRAVLRERGLDALHAELAAHPLFSLRTQDPEAGARVAAAVARCRGADLAGPAAPPAPASAPAKLTELRLPVLVVNGEFDTPQRLRVGTVLEECIAGSERRVVPEAGHLACLDNPAAYRELVEAFLAKNSDPRN
jgi:3-oxoadipate enol-lactonase